MFRPEKKFYMLQEFFIINIQTKSQALKELTIIHEEIQPLV